MLIGYRVKTADQIAELLGIAVGKSYGNSSIWGDSWEVAMWNTCGNVIKATPKAYPHSDTDKPKVGLNGWCYDLRWLEEVHIGDLQSVITLGASGIEVLKVIVKDTEDLLRILKVSRGERSYGTDYSYLLSSVWDRAGKELAVNLSKFDITEANVGTFDFRFISEGLSWEYEWLNIEYVVTEVAPPVELKEPQTLRGDKFFKLKEETGIDYKIVSVKIRSVKKIMKTLSSDRYLKGKQLFFPYSSEHHCGDEIVRDLSKKPKRSHILNGPGGWTWHLKWVDITFEA